MVRRCPFDSLIIQIIGEKISDIIISEAVEEIFAECDKDVMKVFKVINRFPEEGEGYTPRYY